MSRYAQQTLVSVEKSRTEIERTLTRYGADQFIYGWDRDQAVIGFRMHDKQVKFLLPLPDKDDPEFKFTPSKKYKRTDEDRVKAWEQACRSSWRALGLVVKAKLEAVEAGITSFEEEFLAHIVMVGGETFGRWALPQVEEMYRTGTMPRMLPGLPAAHETRLGIEDAELDDA